MSCPNCNGVVSVPIAATIQRTGTNGKVLPIYPAVVYLNAPASCECGWRGQFRDAL